MDTLAKNNHRPLTRGLQFFYTAFVWLFILGQLAQVYFIGLALFFHASWTETHEGFGHPLAISALLIPLLAPLGRFPHPIIGLSLLVFFLTLIQWLLVTMAYALNLPMLNALHPVNALLLFMASVILAYRAQRYTLKGQI